VVPAAGQGGVGAGVGEVRVDDGEREGLELGILAATGEVVDDRHRVALRDETAREVDADEAGAAEYQDPHRPASTNADSLAVGS